jgi:basic amino acid/polyamine antiporter, APA family
LETSHSQNFHRNIGLKKAILHMMGNMIGVGIFIYPVLIASQLPHPIWFLIIWLIGGLIALAGALSSAELGTFFPEAGGDYAYLRNAYGKRWAFLYGFLTFFITFPGSIAIGVGLTVHYQGASLLGQWVNDIVFSLPFLEVRYYQILACLIVIILTIINHIGTSSSFLLQKLVTLGPIVFLIFISLVAIVFIQWDLLWNGLSGSMLAKNMSIPFQMPELFGLATALVPVYWTFSGWNSPLALGEEIQNPEKIIPKTMILGPMIVTVIYLLFSFVFIAVVPYFDFKEGKVDPYIVIGQYMLSNLGIYEKHILELLPKVMSLIIFLIVLGNTNSCIVSGSRIYVAMARDKLFWEKVGYIDPVKKNPVVSIWLQSLWAIMLIIFISKESNLLNFSFIAITLLSVMTIFSIFLIRLRRIQIAKLYKAYGYPFTPILYIFSSLFILVLIIIGYINEKKFSIIISAIATITIGLIVYEIWKRYSMKTKEN